jgi:hypothetical protein
VVTLTLSVVTSSSRLAGMLTTIWPLPIDDGVSVVLPNCTVAPATNPAPVIVSVSGPLPTGAERGLMLVIAGTGFSPTFVIVKVRVFDSPPLACGSST